MSGTTGFQVELKRCRQVLGACLLLVISACAAGPPAPPATGPTTGGSGLLNEQVVPVGVFREHVLARCLGTKPVPAVVERYLARPQVQQRVDQLSRAFRTAGQRLAFSRARWAVGRLIQLGSRDDEVGRKALVDLLKLALTQSSAEKPTERENGQENNDVTEELTKYWTENEWNVFAKLLAGGGEQLPATQTDH